MDPQIFLTDWIRGSVIMSYGSGARGSINYGSGRIGSYLDIIVANEKKYVVNYQKVPEDNHKKVKIINFFLIFLKSLKDT